MTYKCCVCDKEYDDTEHNYRRIMYAYKKYTCQPCSILESKHPNDNESYEPVLNAIRDYFYGLFVHNGVYTHGTIILIPKDGIVHKIMIEFAEATKLISCNEHNRVFTVLNAGLIQSTCEVFGITNDDRRIKTCKLTRKDNPSFYRSVVDCNYTGNNDELILRYHTSVLQSFPPAQYSTIADDIEHRVYKGIQLMELLGSVYEDVMAYQCLIEHMKSSYPSFGDYSAVPSKEEIADMEIVNKYKEMLPFMVPDTMFMYAQATEPKSIRFIRTSPAAVIPTRAHPPDAGYDVTLTRLIWQEGIYSQYDTDIIVIPSLGMYTTIVGRSSIYKTKFSLANSIGIIDAPYRGTLKVVLRNDVHDPTMQLKLPATIIQLVPTLSCYTIAFEIKNNPGISATARGDGGFGSTTPGQILPTQHKPSHEDKTNQPTPSHEDKTIASHEDKTNQPTSSHEDKTADKYEHVGC